MLRYRLDNKQMPIKHLIRGKKKQVLKDEEVEHEVLPGWEEDISSEPADRRAGLRAASRVRFGVSAFSFEELSRSFRVT